MGWDSGSQAWGGAAASGGGGGAAAPLVTLPYKNLDLTSGHTLVEPDGLTISGVAIDSGTKVMTFTMNELATGDAKYNISGSGAEWPRYHAALVDGAGVRLTTADTFTMHVKISLFGSTIPSSADIRYACGVCVTPAATTTGDFDGHGIGLRTRSASRVGGHAKLDTTSGGFSNFNSTGTDTVYGQIIRSARRITNVVSFGEVSNADTAQQTTNATNGTVQFAATTDLNLWFGISTGQSGTSTGAVAASQTFACRVDYCIVRLR
tara:strand:+ start:752 stop:1543 length:792 start_codon:yes stop_codon:yes gene_type:complete